LARLEKIRDALFRFLPRSAPAVGLALGSHLPVVFWAMPTGSYAPTFAPHESGRRNGLLEQIVSEG
jgi:hypothetical protein